jgi:multidrug transporter EmrE-like cation transporter
MVILLRFLIFVGTLVAGIVILKYQRKIVDIVGHNQWCEEHLGPGGTYTMWTGIGVVIILAGVYILVKGW